MKKNLTELVFILDRSGSMGGLEPDTIGGDVYKRQQSFRPQHLMGRFVGFLGADIDARIAPVWPQIVGK